MLMIMSLMDFSILSYTLRIQKYLYVKNKK